MSRLPILERNVERLLRRAYRPAACRAEFREELRQGILARVGISPSAIRWRSATRLALAASILVGTAVGLFWALFLLTGGTGPESVGLGAHVAGREGPPGVSQPAAPGMAGRKAASGRRTSAESAEGPPPVSEPSRETEPFATLVGIVRDRATGAPLTRVRVALLRESDEPRLEAPSVREFEDPEGHFRWDRIPPGRYSVYVTADGYATARKLGWSGSAPGAGLALELGRGGRIRGRVVDGATGLPVEGAIVHSEPDTPARYLWSSLAEIPPGSGAAAKTLADGTFDLPHASAGSQRLRASKAGYAPSWTKSLALEEGGELEGLNLVLGAGGGIRGSVQGATGTPLAGALVVATYDLTRGPEGGAAVAASETREDGTYEIAKIAAGPYAVLVFETREASRPLTGTDVRAAEVRPGEWTEVSFGGLGCKARLHGKVVPSRGRLPLAYTMSVVPFVGKVGGGWKASAIATDGGYSIPDLDPGPHGAYLAKPFGTEVVRLGLVDIPANADWEQDFALPDGKIRGMVSLPGGNPAAGAVLVLQRMGGPAGEREFWANTRADARGHFTIPYLPSGTFELTAYPVEPGFAFERAGGLSLGEDADLALDLRIQEGGEIAIRALDTSKTGVADVEIRCFDAEGVEVAFTPPPQRTDAEGRFAAKGARFGRWRVVVERDGKKIGEGWVDVVQRGTHALEIPVER